MPSVLENYVILETGIPIRLHFTDHAIVRKMITDSHTKSPTSRNTLVFMVDRINGQPSAAQYSIIAEKHAKQFEPYLEGNRYKDFEFTIVRIGEEYLTNYSVTVTPLK